MSTPQWAQRSPYPDTDHDIRWRGSPKVAADLTRLRHELAAEIGRGSGPDEHAEDLDGLLLVFEELASNGLRHGRPPVWVHLAAVRTGWLLDVSDAAADRPPLPAHDRDAAAGGMGLPLVARLAAAHGWTVDGDRKHVWARMDVGTAGDVPVARIRGLLDDRAAALGFRPFLQAGGRLAELTDDLVTDLLAVIAEALTNVAQHARAGSVDVDLAVTADSVTLGVRDDGVGVSGTPRFGGLADLRRRAAWHGGTLAVRPEPAGGTRLTWAVPRRPAVPQPRARS